MSSPPRQENGTPLLEVRDLTVHHGQLRALDRVSLRVFPGEVYAIIGANGAGKSTLLRTIAGLHHPTEGAIVYGGKDMTRVRPERRATAGLVMVPEGRRLFGSLTVEENLQVGATYARPGPWTIERVYELFGWMRERRTQRTAQLSGGEQQSVAIGRALVANPRVLLLDELSLGLAPVVVQRIYAMMPQILASGLTVLLVEQDVSQALRVASHLQCLLEGHTTLEGRPSDVTPDQVEAVLAAVRTSPKHGRRDYAMMLLMARLGLRAPEVIAIQLDDIDWRSGELLIRGKGQRHDRVPIPPDVGEALAT